MRRIEKITGRTDDMIILRGVNLFPTQIEELILRVPSLSPHFQCHLARPGRMDQMTLRVERRSGIDALVGDQGGAALSKLVKNHIGVTVAVDVVDPGGSNDQRARCGASSTNGQGTESTHEVRPDQNVKGIDTAKSALELVAHMIIHCPCLTCHLDHRRITSTLEKDS